MKADDVLGSNDIQLTQESLSHILGSPKDFRDLVGAQIANLRVDPVLPRQDKDY
jgi:hypothetical protein